MVELNNQELQELLRIFRTESEEQILRVGKLLLELEEAPKNTSLVDEILREMHTLKGSSGMLDFKTMQELSHRIEDIFKLVKERKLNADGKTINIAFECLDVLTTIRDQRVEGLLPNVDLTDLRKKLDLLNTGKGFSYQLEFDEQGKSPRERIVERLFVDAEEERELREEEIEEYQNIKSAIEELSQDFGDAITEHEIKASKGYSGVINTVPTLKIDDSIRVSSKDIDQIIKHVEKLEKEGHVSEKKLEKLRKELLLLRMVRFSKLFDLLPRLVRELARTLRKEVELQTYGGEIEVEKNILEKIKDPLVHIIRNSIDHGIEKPRERQILGKGKRGLITVSAEKDNQYIVEVSDDGKGISQQKIRDMIVEKGLAKEAEVAKMDDAKIMHYMFMPGFSTSKEVDLVSGRGVGLDVVKKNIEKLGGTIMVETTLGKGTKIILRIPKN